MIKKLTLWIIVFAPLWAIAQQGNSNPLATKKHKKVKQVEYYNSEHPKPLPEEEKPDFNKESLFKAHFIAGMNIAQLDGDEEYGYRKFGLLAGVGTVVKFSKLFSVSMDLLYSQKGSKPRYGSYDNGVPNNYNVSLDYLEIPISFNIHDKKVVMFGAGLQLGGLMRYYETDTAGKDITANPRPKGQQPRKLDLSGQIGVTFFIKQQIGLGLKFSYSLLPLRDAFSSSSLKGEYNNTISIRISYLLDPRKARRKK
jgi:hypothetical protein